MFKKIIIFLIFTVIILSAVGYWLYRENTYSKEILRLELSGPETAIIGQEIEYTIRIRNNGDVRLKEPRLVFEYPDSAQPVDGESLRITKESDELGGAIYPGQEKVFRFRARLFGRQGEGKEAMAMVSYRPRNLRARYVSRTSHLITMAGVPLTFEFDIPSRVGSGQDMNFSLNYFSSIGYPLSDIEIRISYPAAFELEETNPRGISDNEWRISHLNKAEGGRIEIRGSLTGETGATEVFQAEIGLWQRGEFIVMKRAIKRVKIVEPSLYIIQTINNYSNFIAHPGDFLHYEITFRNIGDNPLQRLFLVSKLDSELFDFESIRSPMGQAQVGHDSIFWDWRNVSSLKFLDAGEEGTVEFWIELKDRVQGVNEAQLKNEIILGQARRKFITKVNTKLEIVQSAHIDDEIFGSEGRLPPQVGEESLFTVLWQVKNYYNSVKDAKVRAILPAWTRLTGKVSLQKLAFDPETREIVWSIEELEPEERLQLAFQLALRPVNRQKGGFAQLVGEVEIISLDKWTEQQVQATSTLISTEIFGEENGRVQ